LLHIFCSKVSILKSALPGALEAFGPNDNERTLWLRHEVQHLLGPGLIQLLHHMLMLNDLFQLIRGVEELHVLGHVDHIVYRVFLVHVLEM